MACLFFTQGSLQRLAPYRVGASTAVDVLMETVVQISNLSNILLDNKEAEELAGTFDALKEVVAFSIEMDAVASAFSASSEYVKMEGTELLATYFEEAELDLFGTHNYDVCHEHKLEPKKRLHHKEWKPA
ncbi:hypothetical protein NBRC10512_004351 [Rhodotorula toruloides]|uniref:Phosphogluconate dehydrogenase (Decarboxylating) n=1 Tax=Rhodotorula toruloides (strain NP11) TaxID=1130832 RepID=M7X9J7_RHOT1|nr:phosphogluconate dehydrogenase (decarboxylating) [Rhodotorula toruloides NP11]EMS20389.1 phosphogluconate dehydrogenase (decarboxylating) [Rhodotorula toruloides NP11]